MSPWHREWFRIKGETGEEQRAGVLQGSRVRDEQGGANVRGTASQPHQPALSETRSVGQPRACPATSSHRFPFSNPWGPSCSTIQTDWCRDSPEGPGIQKAPDKALGCLTVKNIYQTRLTLGRFSSSHWNRKKKVKTVMFSKPGENQLLWDWLQIKSLGRTKYQQESFLQAKFN